MDVATLLQQQSGVLFLESLVELEVESLDMSTPVPEVLAQDYQLHLSVLFDGVGLEVLGLHDGLDLGRVQDALVVLVGVQVLVHGLDEGGRLATLCLPVDLQ